MLEKDLLFAKMLLDDAEYRLYHQLYEGLKPQATAPDLVIYLQAKPSPRCLNGSKNAAAPMNARSTKPI
jgi:hypothetical protein